MAKKYKFLIVVLLLLLFVSWHKRSVLIWTNGDTVHAWSLSTCSGYRYHEDDIVSDISLLPEWLKWLDKLVDPSHVTWTHDGDRDVTLDYGYAELRPGVNTSEFLVEIYSSDGKTTARLRPDLILLKVKTSAFIWMLKSI